MDDPSLDSVVSWSKSNKSFIIWNLKEFERQVLSRISCVKLAGFFRMLGEHVSVWIFKINY